MLPKRRRIPRHLFPTDPRTGNVYHAPHFSLRVTPAKISGARVSVVVSKKVASKSVDRHLVKRRIYDSVRRAEKATPLSPATYVFFAKKDAHTIPFSLLHQEILSLIESAIVKPSRLV